MMSFGDWMIVAGGFAYIAAICAFAVLLGRCLRRRSSDYRHRQEHGLAEADHMVAGQGFVVPPVINNPFHK